MIQYSSLNDAWGNSNKEIYKKIINTEISDKTESSNSISPTILPTESSIYNLNQKKNNTFTIVKKQNVEEFANMDTQIEYTDEDEMEEPIDILLNTNSQESNEIVEIHECNAINHIMICEECRHKLRNILDNDNKININLNGRKININKNILKIIFILLILLILLILISMCKTNNNTAKNKYYNELYMDPYLRQLLYNRRINQ